LREYFKGIFNKKVSDKKVIGLARSYYSILNCDSAQIFHFEALRGNAWFIYPSTGNFDIMTCLPSIEK